MRDNKDHRFKREDSEHREVRSKVKRRAEFRKIREDKRHSDQDEYPIVGTCVFFSGL